jgi:hypothetical protein
VITPTEKDIGRAVVYRDTYPNAPIEKGVVSRLSRLEGMVFVRFRGPGGELTPCHKLEWAEQSADRHEEA